VDRTSGVVYVNADLSGITSQRTFFYHVLVDDNGVPPLSSTASLTIIVNSTIPVPRPSAEDLLVAGAGDVVIAANPDARRRSMQGSTALSSHFPQQ